MYFVKYMLCMSTLIQHYFAAMQLKLYSELRWWLLVFDRFAKSSSFLYDTLLCNDHSLFSFLRWFLFQTTTKNNNNIITIPWVIKIYNYFVLFFFSFSIHFSLFFFHKLRYKINSYACNWEKIRAAVHIVIHYNIIYFLSFKWIFQFCIVVKYLLLNSSLHYTNTYGFMWKKKINK